jgi:hypothetical protein
VSVITAHHSIFRDTHFYVDDTGGPGRPVALIQVNQALVDFLA